MSDIDLPSAEEIMAAHAKIEEEYDMKYRGTRVAGPKLDLRRILRDVASHDNVYDRAAQLLRDLITAHIFEDGNKRTGWLVMRRYLMTHDITPAETRREDTEPVLNAIRAFEVDELSEWLETGTIDDSKFHP